MKTRSCCPATLLAFVSVVPALIFHCSDGCTEVSRRSNFQYPTASLAAQAVKIPPAVQETWV